MATNMVASVTLELSGLSSCLLSKVTHFLDTTELCDFDSAINNRQLRAKYLFGVSNDTFLFNGEHLYSKQQAYVQWLLLRRVFLKSIYLDSDTSATTLLLYDILNRANPGLEKLFLEGKVDFPQVLALRNKKTLHTLALSEQFIDDSRQVEHVLYLQDMFKNIREWREAGGVLKVLLFTNCEFGDEVVDVGDCGTITDFIIDDCNSDRYTAPGDSQGYTHLIWDIVRKCTNLRTLHLESDRHEPSSICFSDMDVSVVARFCPNLNYLYIDALGQDSLTDKAIIHLATKCTNLQQLFLMVKTQFTDATFTAVAANLVSLTRLGFNHLQLQNPRTLRCLAHCCPQLEWLNLYICNATEAELLLLVKQAKNLQHLAIRRWGHLDFRDGGTELTPQQYEPQDLSLFDAEEPARVLSSQLEWLGRMAVHTQLLPGELDSAEKLEAASSHPSFKLVVMERVVAEEEEEEEGGGEGEWDEEEGEWGEEEGEWEEV
ncbi:hypothetical protein B484DRAFT_452467 [Ochromonadaceae sp. CCMP2298]|nr:hypothetical protein B484DRAFT_452467 [Ochromonadaceae sp. CCMP2298]